MVAVHPHVVQDAPVPAPLIVRTRLNQAAVLIVPTIVIQVVSILPPQSPAVAVHVLRHARQCAPATALRHVKAVEHHALELARPPVRADAIQVVLAHASDIVNTPVPAVASSKTNCTNLLALLCLK